MISFKLVFLLFLGVAIQYTNVAAVTYSKCELVALLRSQFPENQVADWLCLIQYESSFTTSKRGGPNKDGSYDYGLFQINSKYWCRIGQVGGDCNENCNNFLDNNVSNDFKCAKKIYGRHGFNAWYGWKNNCQRSKPSISECSQQKSVRTSNKSQPAKPAVKAPSVSAAKPKSPVKAPAQNTKSSKNSKPSAPVQRPKAKPTNRARKNRSKRSIDASTNIVRVPKVKPAREFKSKKLVKSNSKQKNLSKKFRAISAPENSRN
jgi:lysozyme C